jgi:hypothetical protein
MAYCVCALEVRWSGGQVTGKEVPGFVNLVWTTGPFYADNTGSPHTVIGGIGL